MSLVDWAASTVLLCRLSRVTINCVRIFSHQKRSEETSGGAQQSQWVDPKENFQPPDLLIGGWFTSHFPVIVALVCGACPALLSVEAPSVPIALFAFWIKPDYLHCEGWAR